MSSPASRTLIRGGRVFTSNPEHLWSESVVIHDDKIAFIGSAADALAAAGPNPQIIELNGGVVMPGFVDAHAHLLLTGAAILKAQLRTAKSLDDVRSRLIEWRKINPDAKRILGIGWQFSALPEGGPTKFMLDDIFPDVPVYLDAFDLHSCWVNSAALQELGIDDTTPNPIGGEIVRDPKTKEATGLLFENVAFLMIWPLLANVDEKTADSQLRAALAAYNETGVTTSVDMALQSQGLQAMRRAELDGTLSVRIVGHWFMNRDADPEKELEQVRLAARLSREYSSDFLKIVGIKIISDGSIDGCTAALTEPYTNGKNCDPIWDVESLQRVVTAADAAGLQIALHAIGDSAIRNAIDALEHAQRVNGTAGKSRHRIEHLEYTAESDVARLAPLGITASMQPVHIDPAIHTTWAEVMGEERSKRGFAWREFLDAGTTLAFGTDTPTAPYMPLHNMYIAATRKSPGDPTLPPHRPHNALPLPEAVIHGTKDAAWASFLQDKVGMLKEGLLADLIILDSDPFNQPPESLLTAKVIRTILGGRTVHEQSSN
jgi:predicted amidohydrolase YtcJ